MSLDFVREELLQGFRPRGHLGALVLEVGRQLVRLADALPEGTSSFSKLIVLRLSSRTMVVKRSLTKTQSTSVLRLETIAAVSPEAR